MNIDTVIFDLDGTLLNTLNDLHCAFNYAMKSNGFNEYSIEEVKSFVGNGIKKAFEKALPENVTEKSIDKVIQTFKMYYLNNMYNKTKPYDGILQMLEELKNKGFKLAIVSNKFDDAVKTLSKKYFKEYIDIAVGEGCGTERKPNPSGILKAIKELNSSIEKTIYAGDSEVDIKTAENAGVPCISVLWGFKDKEFLIKNGGKIFAETPVEIVKIIEKKLYLV